MKRIMYQKKGSPDDLHKKMIQYGSLPKKVMKWTICSPQKRDIANAASIQESEPRLYMNAQTNLSHPWHQHWAETICCQQLSLLAQTLAPEGGARLKSQTKSENENGDEKKLSLYL